MRIGPLFIGDGKVKWFGPKHTYTLFSEVVQGGNTEVVTEEDVYTSDEACEAMSTLVLWSCQKVGARIRREQITSWINDEGELCSKIESWR